MRSSFPALPTHREITYIHTDRQTDTLLLLLLHGCPIGSRHSQEREKQSQVKESMAADSMSSKVLWTPKLFRARQTLVREAISLLPRWTLSAVTVVALEAGRCKMPLALLAHKTTTSRDCNCWWQRSNRISIHQAAFVDSETAFAGKPSGADRALQCTSLEMERQLALGFTFVPCHVTRSAKGSITDIADNGRGRLTRFRRRIDEITPCSPVSSNSKPIGHLTKILAYDITPPPTRSACRTRGQKMTKQELLRHPLRVETRHTDTHTHTHTQITYTARYSPQTG